ncbi:MAG: carboxyl transferase domain-containing protein [Mesorhizobium sp.]
MSWEKEVSELNRLTAMTAAMGGEEALARRKKSGRLNVRERIDRLVDDGTFREVGALTGRPEFDDAGVVTKLSPGNFIFGRAKIDGRPVAVAGDDYSVVGSAGGATIPGKFGMCEKMANELRIPLVRLLESTGGNSRSLEQMGRTYIPQMEGWETVIANMATIPVVSLGLGPVAGIGAAKMVFSHYAVMVRNQSHMFMAGPPLVARLGEVVTKEELGGADLHARAGGVDEVVDSEEEAFAAARRFLSYLPASVHELPPRAEPEDDPERRDPWLIQAVPKERRRVYDMRRVIKSVFDAGSFTEMTRRYGASVITGLARLDGWPVAVMASDPYQYGGAWTNESNQKIERFVDLANTFHLPVVNLVDVPGFLIGRDAEMAGTIRSGARALSAVFQAKVPWCTVMIRKVFGVAGASHADHSRYHYRFSWPSGDWGSIPVEGGIESAYKDEIASAADPEAMVRQIESRLNEIRSPLRTAMAFDCEDIIDPRDTRPLLCEFANNASRLRMPGTVATGMRP